MNKVEILLNNLMRIANYINDLTVFANNSNFYNKELIVKRLNQCSDELEIAIHFYDSLLILNEEAKN